MCMQRSYHARGTHVTEVHGLHVSHLKFPRATDEEKSPFLNFKVQLCVVCQDMSRVVLN